MSMKKAIIFCALSATITLVTVAQDKRVNGAPQDPTSTTSGARRTRSMPQEDADALRDDLKKMRALVQQMESNLAFVDTTQSPLKHQFQLEIDMWRTVIDHMERRLNAAKPR